MFMKYLLTYETLSKFSKKLRRNDYFLTKKEFFTTLNPEMPDELLEYIYSWYKIKKSSYSNDSYYNNNKSWSSFVDGVYDLVYQMISIQNLMIARILNLFSIYHVI
jgi:hypothetical protein